MLPILFVCLQKQKFHFYIESLEGQFKNFGMPQVDPYCPYYLFVYKHNNFIGDNEGKRNFILVILHANFTYLDVLTSVLPENSMKEVLLDFILKTFHTRYTPTCWRRYKRDLRYTHWFVQLEIFVSTSASILKDLLRWNFLSSGVTDILWENVSIFWFSTPFLEDFSF